MLIREVIIIILGIGLLSGCAQLKPVKEYPEKDYNNITMLRNYNFQNGGIHFWPTVNGNNVAGLLVKQHVSFYLAPGQYKLGVNCYAGTQYFGEGIEVTLIENMPRYFLLSTFFTGCAEIEEIEKREAENRLKDSRRIKTGRISDCKGKAITFDSAKEALCLGFAIP